MSFELANIVYAPDRKLGTFKKIVIKDVNKPNSPKYIYNPVPYDLDFNLYILAKFEEDANKIIEQILPFFTPDFVPTIELLPEMGLIVDVPIVLKSVNHEDRFEGPFESKRIVLWTLSFSLKGFFYGPVRTSAIIKFIEADLIDLDTLGRFEQVHLQPGLTANGEPTTSANDSIDPLLINKEDDWGVVTEIRYGPS